MQGKITAIYNYDGDYVLLNEDEEGSRNVLITFEDDILSKPLPSDTNFVLVSDTRRLGAVISSYRRRIQIYDFDDENS